MPFSGPPTHPYFLTYYKDGPEGSKKNFCISSHVRCAQTIVKDRYSPPPAFARCCFLLLQENYKPLTTKKQTLKISVTCTCQHYYLCTNQGNIKENRHPLLLSLICFSEAAELRVKWSVCLRSFWYF